MLRRSPARKPAENVPDFHVTEQPDRYIIQPVPFMDDLYEVHLSKSLLDDGALHTLSEWAPSYGEWQHPSGPLLMSIKRSLWEHQEGEYRSTIAAVQQFFQKTYAECPAVILRTRIAHDPKPQWIVHDFGTTHASTARADLPGYRKRYGDWIETYPRTLENCLCGRDDPYIIKSFEPITGIGDAQQLHAVAAWCSGAKQALIYGPWLMYEKPGLTALTAGVMEEGKFVFCVTQQIQPNARTQERYNFPSGHQTFGVSLRPLR